MKIGFQSISKKIRELLYEYGRISLFAFSLLTAVCVSVFLSRYIPVELFETKITLGLHLCILFSALVGAVVLQWHIYGIRARRVWQVCLIFFSLIEIAMLVAEEWFGVSTIIFGVHTLNEQDLLVRDMFAILMLAYPIAVLYPKFLTLRNIVLMALPPFVIYGLNQVLHEDMRILLIVYPLAISGILMTRIHSYRKSLEDNYSTLENNAMPWLKIYTIILSVSGLMYIYLCFTYHPTRLFTQQWLVLALITYNTVQIVARKNPWHEVEPEEDEPGEPDAILQAEYRAALDEWMEKEKPYLDKDFRLVDLMKVLPMNRTYLSQFVNATYGCNFYQYVTQYRIEEAKRLMRANPDMRLQDVAEQSGFSSASVFSRTFTRETGYSPTSWAEQVNAL